VVNISLTEAAIVLSLMALAHYTIFFQAIIFKAYQNEVLSCSFNTSKSEGKNGRNETSKCLYISVIDFR
jgi:hypothetical protein